MILAREWRFPNKPPGHTWDVFVFRIRIPVGTTVNKPNNRKLQIEMGERDTWRKFKGMKCGCLHTDRGMTKFFTCEEWGSHLLLTGNNPIKVILISGRRMSSKILA